jgi:SLT domain-containing protein
LFWKGLGDIFAGAWDLFLAALGLAFVALETAFGAAIALVTAVWDGLWALIQSVAADAFKAVKDTVFNGMKDANTLIVNAGKDIVKAFESIWAGITDGASKVFGTVLGFFRSGINDIIGVLNSFIHVVDDVLGAFGIPKIPAIPLLSGGAAGGQPTSTANIGFHASGGIVNTPMAIVGEGNPAHPEWVIPTDPQHRQRALGLYASLGTQLMSVGGPVGSIIGGVESGASAVGSGIRSFTGGVASGLLDVALGPVHAAVGAIPNGFIRSLADGLISKLVAGVGSFISGHGGSTGGGPIPTGQHLTLIKQALGIAGAADTGPIEAALNTIVTHESGWNPQAINLTDSNAAAGDPSRGLGQTIMSTFEAFRSLLLPDNIFDPLANLVASINYADSRYGSLLNVPGVIAESQGRGYVGYDSGGYLPPGITTVFNGTGRPEPVLTPGQLSAVASGTQGGDGAATLGLLREQNLLLRRIIAEVPEGVGRHVLAGIDGQIEQHDRAFAQVAGAQR